MVTHGYGTNFGTNFGGGIGRYDAGKKGFSKKALGLGVAAGFLVGASVGVGGTMATYGAVHKYKKFRSLLYASRRHRYLSGRGQQLDEENDQDQWDKLSSWGGRNWNQPYEDEYYRTFYERLSNHER